MNRKPYKEEIQYAILMEILAFASEFARKDSDVHTEYNHMPNKPFPSEGYQPSTKEKKWAMQEMEKLCNTIRRRTQKLNYKARQKIKI